MQFIDTGRVFHTTTLMESRYDTSWEELIENTRRIEATSPVYRELFVRPGFCEVMMSASTAESQVRFELDAYEPGQCREHNDPRAEKWERLNKRYGWFDTYTRDCKRERGYRQRGTPTPATYTTLGGRKGIATSWKESFQSWKDHKDRPYQAHGRIRGEADC